MWGEVPELKLGAWQWQQRLEQKNADFADFPFFSRDSDVTLGILTVHFWTSFRHEIRWCFGLARGCVGRSSGAEAWSLAVAAAAGAEECR